MRTDFTFAQPIAMLIGSIISFFMMLNVRAETNDPLTESASNRVSRPAAITHCGLATLYVEGLGKDGSLAIALLPSVERNGIGHYILLEQSSSEKLTGVNPQNGLSFMLDWNDICNDEASVVLMFVSRQSRNWLFRPMSQIELLTSGAFSENNATD